MNRSKIRLAFVVVALLCLGGTPALQAEWTPNPGSLYTTATGLGSTMAAACADAREELADRCTLTGPVTEIPQGCQTLYDIFGNPVGTVCTCKVRTATCWNPLPF